MLSLTQQQLADAIGLSFQQVQKYENGINRIGVSRLKQIAEALQCDPAWLLAETPSFAGGSAAPALQRLDADLSAFFADKNAASLVRGFVRLRPAAKRAIVRLITIPEDDARPG